MGAVLAELSALDRRLGAPAPSGGAGAHAVEEWVDLDHVERCARTLVAVAAEWCS